MRFEAVFYSSLILLISLSSVKSQDEEDILIEISQGTLRGFSLQNRDGGTFYGFTGIPYGQAPIGELRFKAPVAADTWDGILNATEEIPQCTQCSTTEVSGQEDCLYLNVYIPELPNENTTKKPVMAYIHGGGFHGGTAGEAGPNFLLTKDIILVAINYRLGVFGFMNFQDTELGVPGNAGMKDQVLGLKWVRDNIEEFGGDPDNVLLFGFSAGGRSVHLHLVSPMSAGLFNKVLGQSGVATEPTLISAVDTGVTLAQQLGLQTEDLAEALESLKALSNEEICQAEAVIRDDTLALFATPTIESSESTEEAFLSQRPIDIIRSGNYNQVPYVTGFTNLEGVVRQMRTLQATAQNFLIEDFTEFIPYDLDIEAGSEAEAELSARIKEFYYGDDEPNRDDLMPGLDLQTDFEFAFPAYYSSVVHVNTSSQPVYVYYYTVDAAWNNELFQEYPGAAHGDDVPYIFSNGDRDAEEGTVEDLLIKNMVAIWTNFAIYGNPTPDDSLGFTWLPVTAETFNCLHIDTSSNNATVNPREPNIAFWSQIYEDYSSSASRIFSFSVCIILSVFLLSIHFLF